MLKLNKFPLLLLGSSFLFACSSAHKKPPEKPNILLIMLDDMGYSDPGCFGGEIRTPNMDRLAEEGIRFTQMHNCARCCPTRASVLTGLYPQQAGISGMGVNLAMNAATIAEVLKEEGYHTGMTGKWHLSTTRGLPDHDQQLRWLAHRMDNGSFSPLENYPCNRGFEEHWGVIWGVVNYFDPFSLVHNEEAIKEVPDGFYMTDFITEKSLELLDSYSQDDKPFFLYVAHTAPHWPLHALPEDIGKYQGTYDLGWEVLRQKRYRRMLDMGLIDSLTYPLPENSSGRSWESCQKKAYEAACMQVHAAMVDRVDQSIGKIIERLKKNGQFENTVIFILSDNGASYERAYPPGFDRPGFTRDSTIIVYNAEKPGSEETWNYIGDAWASAVNTPFRYWKKESYEGGSATPFIIHWPAGLRGKENTLNHGLAHVIDILPTCLELAGAAYPEEINGLPTLPLPGSSLLPLLLDEKTILHDTLYWEHEGGRAIRTAEWKMSALSGQPWELFHISRDYTETRNLATTFPEIRDSLAVAWEHWARTCSIPFKKTF